MSEITEALFNKYAPQAEAVTSDKHVDPKMPLPMYIHPDTRQRFFSAIERTRRARLRAAKAAAGV